MTSGEQHFDTVTGGTYKSHGNARPASMIVQKPQITSQSRVRFDARTMAETDFPQKNGGRQKAVTPPRPTIDLKFDNR